MKTQIAIDIGKSGYFCFMRGAEIITKQMPLIGKEVDYLGIRNLLSKYQQEECHVTFERLTSLHLASKKANWSLSNQAGTIRGIIIGLGLPFSEIAPKLWQKSMLEGIPEIKDSAGKKDTKAMAHLAVTRLYPQLNLLRTEKCTRPDDGMIDSVLIATFSQRNNL